MSEGGCRFGEICAKLHGVFECIPIARTTDHPSGKSRHYFAAFSSGSPNFSYQDIKYCQAAAASNPSTQRYFLRSHSNQHPQRLEEENYATQFQRA